MFSNRRRKAGKLAALYLPFYRWQSYDEPLSLAGCDLPSIAFNGLGQNAVQSILLEVCICQLQSHSVAKSRKTAVVGILHSLVKSLGLPGLQADIIRLSGSLGEVPSGCDSQKAAGKIFAA